MSASCVPVFSIEMSGQKYKRTHFDEEESMSTSGTPPGVVYDPAIAFKVGATFWQKRSNLERLLFIVVTALLLTVIILSALLMSKNPSTQHTFPQEQCLTEACVTVASSILSAMDHTADPCEDFYQYTCGGWTSSHPIPSGLNRWGTFGVMWKENQLVMRNVLEKPIETYKSEAEKKAKFYYQSCMDKNKTIETLGGKPLLQLIQEYGGWPLIDGTSLNSTWNFQERVQKMHSLGIAVFFNLWVGDDEKQPTKNILQFDQDGLLLPCDMYLNTTIDGDETLTAYLKFMVDTVTLLGGPENDTKAEMRKVLLFEQQIANITTPQDQRRDDMKLYNKMSLQQLQDRTPNFINWVQYVNSLLSVTNYNVRGKEQVIVYAPEYLGQLTGLVSDMLKTDEGKNTLNNYMMWYFVKLMASFLSKPFREAKKAFSEVVAGVSGEKEHWRYCTTDTDSTVGFALGSMFVREAFKGESKNKAEVMIKEVKNAFKNNLPQLKWMDPETRDAAEQKANAVVDMIGFPEYLRNSSALDDRYRNLKIDPNQYFYNNLRYLKFNMKRNLDKLRKPPDPKSWAMTPPTVNAYYKPTKNEIVFPAGILQAPFYDKDYPKSLNFGGMGVVMGHELTHGFDDQGRKYNKEGILSPWWNNASIDRFNGRTECMVDQYKRYTVNGENVNGKLTLGENIADNGGLKSAYNAYQQWVRDNGEELPLPGVKLTHNQLFFVAFSQVWCSNNMPQADHMALLTDSHSPAKFRVIGPLSNSKEFADNFKCPVDTKMNPKDKCEVW